MVHAQLAKKLLASNISLAGVGFQCHFIGNTVPKDLAASMKMFTDQGLEVPFTELDVRVPVNNRGIANSTWLDIQYVSFSFLSEPFTIRTYYFASNLLYCSSVRQN